MQVQIAVWGDRRMQVFGFVLHGDLGLVESGKLFREQEIA